jgi:hypothetical protein
MNIRIPNIHKTIHDDIWESKRHIHVKGYVVAGDMRFKTNRRSIQKIKGKHAKVEKND